MYPKLLIPLDGSSVSEQVLPYARLMARKLNLAVELLAVVDAEALTASQSVYEKIDIDRLIGDNVRGSAAYLEKIGKKFLEVPVNRSVEKGRPGDLIIAKAAADRGALIAMATHGRSGVDRWLLGSVAEKVLRGTSNPLLLVRASEDGPRAGEATWKSLIVPLDGSPLAEQALRHAAPLAKRMSLELVLFRAYTLKQTICTYEDYMPDWDKLEATLKGEALGYLDLKVEELKREGVANIYPLAAEGEAAQEIVDLAKRIANSLVVICSHGRSGLGRWLLGSVTEKVARHSTGPVLIVRPD